jgi:hypothetical protein
MSLPDVPGAQLGLLRGFSKIHLKLPLPDFNSTTTTWSGD